MTTPLPGFLVIGAQKAGSTWFTRNLRAHPEIFMPLKELRYFTRYYDLGPSWYAEKFSRAGEKRTIGEGTPGYLLHPQAPERISETLGGATLLVASLRNPVDRAYSSFWNLLGGGVLPRDADFLEQFSADFNQMRTRGLYHLQLSRFLQFFPRDQIKVAIMEYDLGARAPHTLRATFEFLGVDPSFEQPAAAQAANVGGPPRRGGPSVGKLGTAVALRSGRLPPPVERILRRGYSSIYARLPTTRQFEPLSDRARAACIEVYQDDIERLAQLLDRDLSVWQWQKGR